MNIINKCIENAQLITVWVWQLMNINFNINKHAIYFLCSNIDKLNGSSIQNDNIFYENNKLITSLAVYNINYTIIFIADIIGFVIIIFNWV